MPDLVQLLQIIGPPLGLYVAIRVDLATMRVRIDHLERDLYAMRKAKP